MICVVLPQTIRNQMKDALRRAGRREIGGILMGEEIGSGNFTIVDFSLDEVSGERAHFVRDIEHHSQALQGFFERTGYDYRRFNYLGEWHSHPGFSARPSVTDILAMQELVNDERGIDFGVLLIVKLAFFRRLATSMSLHRRGYNPEAVELRYE